jgi:hypothetical protein
MREPVILSVISFLLVMLIVYLWASWRNLLRNRALTPMEYLWKFKCIAGKSEYEKACSELKRACDLGYCEHYDIKKRDGVCQ